VQAVGCGQVLSSVRRLPGRLDWDKAILAAIPKLRRGASVQEYAAAAQSALDVLQDPVTRVLTSSPSPPSSEGGERHPSWTKTPDGILVVRINHYGDLLDFDGALKKWEV